MCWIATSTIPALLSPSLKAPNKTEKRLSSSQGEQGYMNIIPAFISDKQPPVSMEPSNASLGNPAVFSKIIRSLYTIFHTDRAGLHQHLQIWRHQHLAYERQSRNDNQSKAVQHLQCHIQKNTGSARPVPYSAFRSASATPQTPSREGRRCRTVFFALWPARSRRRNPYRKCARL